MNIKIDLVMKPNNIIAFRFITLGIETWVEPFSMGQVVYLSEKIEVCETGNVLTNFAAEGLPLSGIYIRQHYIEFSLGDNSDRGYVKLQRTEELELELLHAIHNIQIEEEVFDYL